jgi:hypothetical protein
MKELTWASFFLLTLAPEKFVETITEIEPVILLEEALRISSIT